MSLRRARLLGLTSHLFNQLGFLQTSPCKSPRFSSLLRSYTSYCLPAEIIFSKSHVEDCTQPWTFHADDFDFVHIRYLFGSIPDWVSFFKEAYLVLKPGGWLEDVETSPTLYCKDETPLPSNSAIARWGPLFVNGGKVINRVFTVVEDDIQEKAMREAGFVNIQVKDVEVR